MIHLLMFFGFAFLWAYRPGKAVRTNATLLAGLVFIVLSELGQALPFVDREPDLPDGFADLTGLLLGLLFARLVAASWSRQVPEGA